MRGKFFKYSIINAHDNTEEKLDVEAKEEKIIEARPRNGINLKILFTIY